MRYESGPRRISWLIKSTWGRAVAGIAAVVAVSLVATTVSSPTTVTAAEITPIRAMFYYPWFAETWHANDHYRPALGRYDSDNATVIAAHVAAMHHSGMQAAIASWWGPGQHNEQARFPQLYSAASAQELGVIPYYEAEGYGDPSVTQIQKDLAYLHSYADTYPSAFRIGGKPVIFVYNSGGSGCAEVTRWKAATAGFTTWYVNMKVFAGFTRCADQPSSWHQYGPEVAESVHLPWSFNISPGFWQHDEAAPRLARSTSRWATNVAHMAASGAQWQLVTSFNEWGEATAVEPSPSWQSATGWGAYLDELHRQLTSAGAVVPPRRPVPTSSAIAIQRRPDPSLPPSSPVPTTSMPAPAPAGPTVTVMAAGDIVGDGSTGYGSSSRLDGYTADLLTRYKPDAVLALGDNQYESGSLAQYQAGWGRTSCVSSSRCGSWGKHLANMYPAPGNHEWQTSNAQGYRDYFGPRLAAIGSDTASPSQMYYSFDLGAWHFVSLDSDCSKIGGCDSMSDPMVAWLLTDLAANNGRPTLVFHHHPRWSSGEHGSTGSLVYLHTLLVADRDVQIVLSGHDHWYERFAPMGASGPQAGGVRYFTVGTGGKAFTCTTTMLAGSATHGCNAAGVIHLTLGSKGYSWAFRGIQEIGGPGTYTDAGSSSLR